MSVSLLLFAFITSCSAGWRSFTGETKAYNSCIASYPLSINLPLWQLTEKNCSPASIDPLQLPQTAALFSDTQCQQPITLNPLDISQWCKTLVTRNASFDSLPFNDWRLSPATLADSSVLPLAKRHPLMVRKVYREIKSSKGSCQLTLDIYHPNPFPGQQQTELKKDSILTPMLAIHGGSWRYRKKGLVMLQSQIAQMTANGFVVFTPRYRLVGKAPAIGLKRFDGLKRFEDIAACDGVTAQQQLSDIEAAYQWVKTNASNYSTEGSLVVWGASAGGHLAARLSLAHPKEIKKAVLLYAPIDFQRFAVQEKAARLDGSSKASAKVASKALERYLQQSKPLSQLSVQSDLIQQNSLAHLINLRVIAQQTTPAFFAILGTNDRLVPVDQALSLCAAQLGQLTPIGINSNGVPGMLAAEQQLNHLQACGRGAVYLIQGAGHVMDICLPALNCNRSARQQQHVALALQQAMRWLKASN